MEMNEYQERTSDTAVYPKDEALAYLTMGLAGEAGEVANKMKKVLRYSGGLFLTRDEEESIADELGDVLWYVAQLADRLGYSLYTVADKNLRKLAARQASGMLKEHGEEERQPYELTLVEPAELAIGESRATEPLMQVNVLTAQLTAPRYHIYPQGQTCDDLTCERIHRATPLDPR
jgi:NTP pyrophosphatase (non-canonical NTP hydrolase)